MITWTQRQERAERSARIADTDSAKYQAVRGQKDIDMAENIITVIPTTV